MGTIKKMAVAGAAGATAAYFFDPASGAARRAQARDRVMALLRRGERQAGRAGRQLTSDVKGLAARVTNRPDIEATPTDEQLKAKVESEVLGPKDADGILVNVENGVVVLRGEMDDERRIEELEAAVRAVPGAEAVTNLIHRPGAPAPNKAAAHRATKRAAASTPPTGTAIG
jgi:osmotically-inducible protein OsmY